LSLVEKQNRVIIRRSSNEELRPLGGGCRRRRGGALYRKLGDEKAIPEFGGDSSKQLRAPEEWPIRFMETWQRPAELAPGYTLAFRIITPFATVNAPPSPGRDTGVMWVGPPPPGQVIETAVIITGANTVIIDWPGERSMGTSLVGRFQIDNGDSVWVVSRVNAPPPGLETQLNRSRFFHGKSKADAVGPGLRALAFGVEADSSRVIYEFVEARDAHLSPRDSEEATDAV
jgi:hypothetical protein